jgi:hypothetical protein
MRQESEFHDQLKEIVLSPIADIMMTSIIRDAINKCPEGGTVRFTPGIYHTGTILLKDHLSLYLEKGAILMGSLNYADYTNDAFFYGNNLKDISISGEGIIDGSDCYNPQGEEGFRGPHCIKLLNCSDLNLTGITIRNAANWAINCRKCNNGNVTNVTILGGHDGLHTRFCGNFNIKGCNFRTGDDSFAGNDNQNFTVSDCQINTSCNGFRLGCLNLIVERCRLWGPGEYIHRSQNRNNMLSAFVHFSPKDENPALENGNWLIRDVTVENVDNFFIYNFRNGLWQTGRPFTEVIFDKIDASGLLRAFYIDCDENRDFKMTISGSSFEFRPGFPDIPESFEGVRLGNRCFVYAADFNKIDMENVAFTNKAGSQFMILENGISVSLTDATFNSPDENIPFRIDGVKSVSLHNLYLNGLKLRQENE